MRMPNRNSHIAGKGLRVLIFMLGVLALLSACGGSRNQDTEAENIIQAIETDAYHNYTPERIEFEVPGVGVSLLAMGGDALYFSYLPENERGVGIGIMRTDDFTFRPLWKSNCDEGRGESDGELRIFQQRVIAAAAQSDESLLMVLYDYEMVPDDQNLTFTSEREPA